MLEATDMHIKQIKLFLADTVSKIQPLLDKCNIIQDVEQIVNMIVSDELRYQDCDEQVLSEKSQKYNPSESNHQEFIDKLTLNQLMALEERKPEEWLSNEQFVNCMILPKQHETPNEA